MDEFDRIASEEFDAIPEKWRERMKNVAVIIEEDAPEGEPMLGLYTGVPVTERGGEYGAVLPDTITLFKKPISEFAEREDQSLRKAIRETLWHEIAHHFGFEEEEVYKRETEGSNDFRA